MIKFIKKKGKVQRFTIKYDKPNLTNRQKLDQVDNELYGVRRSLINPNTCTNCGHDGHDDMNDLIIKQIELKLERSRLDR